jgi:hypothetical protein
VVVGVVGSVVVAGADFVVVVGVVFEAAIVEVVFAAEAPASHVAVIAADLEEDMVADLEAVTEGALATVDMATAASDMASDLVLG